jgi:phosphopantothenoylcysteine decarboxylase/phosphopantothenate--cysteine ligase
MNRRPRILLGVSGGIAAYKSAEIVRGLVREGADVRVAMTRGAREFVAPLTFAVLSRHEVHTEVWADGVEAGPNGTAGVGPHVPAGTGAAGVAHVALAEDCDLLLVAPATAHTLAKLAHGLADDFLTTYALAHRGRLLLAPAMETGDVVAPRRPRERRAAHPRGARSGSAPTRASSRRPRGRRAAWRPRRRSSPRRFASRRGRAGDLGGLRLLVTADRRASASTRFASCPTARAGGMGFAARRGGARPRRGR